MEVEDSLSEVSLHELSSILRESHSRQGTDTDDSLSELSAEAFNCAFAVYRANHSVIRFKLQTSALVPRLQACSCATVQPDSFGAWL